MTHSSFAFKMVEQFQDPDDSPLLDIDSDIERSEKHWGEAPVTCDGSDDESSNQTLRDLQKEEWLKKEAEEAKPRRHWLETFFIVNLAMVLFVATISFVKGMQI
jgi:hypothetical protein